MRSSRHKIVGSEVGLRDSYLPGFRGLRSRRAAGRRNVLVLPVLLALLLLFVFLVAGFRSESATITNWSPGATAE